MTDKQDLSSQIKTGMQNFIDEVQTTIKKLKTSISSMGSQKLKEVPIPEEWKDPDAITMLVPEHVAPVAVEPTIIYEQTTKPGLQLIQPGWFIKIKRIVVFVIMIATGISSIGLILTFPFGLIFTVPTFFINFDYLLKTRPKSPIMRWDILPDIEKEEEE